MPNFNILLPYGNILAEKGLIQMLLTPETIGTTIRDTRKKMGVTQKELALTSGTGLRFVIDLEKGKTTCHIGKALTVLQTLGIELTLKAPGQGGKA